MSSLKEEIARALEYFGDQPLSEADTCQSIIVPLLWAAGYERRDIRAQARDNAGQFPDYTVLPDTPHTWFLEGKAWSADLRAEHAIQALNYANSQGRWWVVLTNARVWRLYDNRIQGLPESRLVIEARLGDPSFEGFMMAIGKQSVSSGALEKHALRTRMSTVLLQQLVDADSRVTKALRTVLRSECGLPGIQGSEVASFFRDALLPGSEVSPVRDGKSRQVPVVQPPTTQGVPLDALVECAKGRKPCLVVLPDQTTCGVRHWREVCRIVVGWLSDRQQLPSIPFVAQRGGTRYFLNTEPSHADGREMRSPDEIVSGEQRVFVDTWRSATDTLQCLLALCCEVGVPPSGFAVAVSATEPEDGVG